MSEVADGLVLRGWAVDPASGREGAAEIAVREGVLERLTWLAGADADGLDADGTLILPGLVDLHAHFREPGNEDAETVATGQAAAAHGGFTTVAVMPNTTPAIDEPGIVARVRAAAAASGSPVRVLVHGAVTVGRKGETLAPLGELADAGVAGFSDDGAPVHAAALLRNALAYAGSLGLAIIDHPEDPTLTAGAEASEGYVASVLGLKGWPVAGEAGAVARAIAILADTVVDVPGARLHLTHVSTAASLAHVRAAKAAGLPVTCDVTPHHIALRRRVDRRVAALGLGGGGRTTGHARDPWTDGSLVAAPFDTSLRVNPPLRSPVGRGGLPRGARGRHRGRDRHGPRAAHRGGQARRVRLGDQRDQRDRDGAAGRARGGRQRVGCRSLARSRRSRPARRGSSGSGRSSRPGSARESRRISWSWTGPRPGRSRPRRCSPGARTRRCWAASCAGSCG